MAASPQGSTHLFTKTDGGKTQKPPPDLDETASARRSHRFEASIEHNFDQHRDTVGETLANEIGALGHG